MGTKITARELLFSCAAAPEMIQYYLEIGYLFGVLNRETYWRMFPSLDRSCWRRSGFNFYGLQCPQGEYP